jgi:hypothetical protein
MRKPAWNSLTITMALACWRTCAGIAVAGSAWNSCRIASQLSICVTSVLRSSRRKQRDGDKSDNKGDKGAQVHGAVIRYSVTGSDRDAAELPENTAPRKPAAEPSPEPARHRHAKTGPAHALRLLCPRRLAA